MVALKVPDRLSILTYVSQYYNYFHGRSPIGGMGGIKRPAEGSTDEPSGKKNPPVTAKVFPSTKPARENSPPPSSNITRPSHSPKQTRNVTQDVVVEKSHQAGTLSSRCVSCNKHVHLVQRHLVDGKLYHRTCAKLMSPTNTLSPLRDLPTNTPLSKFTPLADSTKTNAATPTQTPSRLGPTSPTEKTSTASSITATTKESRTAFISKPAASRTCDFTLPTTTSVTTRPIAAPRTSTTAAPHVTTTAALLRISPTAAPRVSTPAAPVVSSTSTPRVSTPAAPVVSSTSTPRVSTPAAPRVSTPAAPVSSSTSTPRVSTTAAPRVSTPAAPVVSSTSTPRVSTPAAPRVSTPAAPVVSSTSTPRVSTTAAPRVSTTAAPRVSTPAAPRVSTPAAPVVSSTSSPRVSTTVATPISTTASLGISTMAAKTRESKLKFFQSETNTNNEEKKPPTNMDVNKGSGKVQQATSGQPVTVVINVGGAGRKETNVSLDKFGEKAEVGAKVSAKQEDNENKKTKASAAAFISKTLAEETNNNNNKASWTNVALKKTDKPQSQVETSKKEPEVVRGRVRLKANPSILDDLQPPVSTNSESTPASSSGLQARTADKGGSKPGSASPKTSVSENEYPADWRSRLKPVKETKPVGPSQPPTSWASGTGKSQTSSSSALLNPTISVTSPVSKGPQNGQKVITANDTESKLKTSKMKPDYIPKEDIMKELDEIEENLNEWEKRGVELEIRLRSSEEEGEDDSLINELMVEWFNLIRNKQVAMRRESELVYIARTQDLEEEQPTVEEELRRLIEKPDRLKTAWDRKREEQLMDKLMEIVNDRNAIVEGLDEDRIREEEEDEELNKMMMNLNIKKDKAKKKSLVAKLFSWGNKKEE
ncbi:MICAL-like protein 2 isoform X2 [Mastacembelus armatus]|nr:MICAL-like protein 2 isoform X2 [Mastacembelus armatus]